MSLQTIILDDRPGYLRGTPGASLLSMPCGTKTLLEDIAGEVESSGGEQVLVFPLFEPDEAYRRTLDRAYGGDVELVGGDILQQLGQSCDPADRVLIVDGRIRPTRGVGVHELIRRGAGNRWGMHAVAMGGTGQGAREMVQLDSEGTVRGVRRFYGQVSFARIEAIAYSLVPVAVLEGLVLEGLHDLRLALSGRGLLSRDVPLADDVWNLSLEAGFLGMAEARLGLMMKSERRFNERGFAERMPGVFVGTGCEIDDGARLLGPVVLQDHVVVRAGATVIGPSVIGAGSVLESGSLVAQSVVGRGTVMEGGASVRHRVTLDGAVDGALEEESKSAWFGGAAGGSVAGGGVVGDQEALLPHVMRSRGSRMEGEGKKRSWLPVVKRAIDLVAAVVGLVLASPIMILSAVMIRLESRGPIFFGHEREGLDGKVFRCLKFRTMCEDADRQQKHLRAANANVVDGPQFKLDNDPRVTRVGGFLRTTNIDELPQLFNVLRGEMSLVGPRPSPFRENQICVPWRRARLSVRPGITGLWQICRHDRAEGDFHQWIAYDITYVRHMSLWLDLKILVWTLLTLGGKRSVRVERLISGVVEPNPPRNSSLAVEVRDRVVMKGGDGAGMRGSSVADSAVVS